MLNACIKWVLIWQSLPKLPNRQIKNIANVSHYNYGTHALHLVINAHWDMNYKASSHVDTQIQFRSFYGKSIYIQTKVRGWLR